MLKQFFHSLPYFYTCPAIYFYYMLRAYQFKYTLYLYYYQNNSRTAIEMGVYIQRKEIFMAI